MSKFRSLHVLSKQRNVDGSLPGVVHTVTLSVPGITDPVVRHCVACEYAGCIWIVVVIVVPTVTAIADSSNIEKNNDFFHFQL
jgi:hypothetical protein